MMFRLAAFLFSIGFASAAYPSEYPFENESVVPAAPRASTPSFTFDDTDAGGYIYTYAYMKTITEDELGTFCFFNSLFWAHQLVIRSDLAPVLPDSNFNCTAKGNFLGPASYFGTVADVKICEEGQCCKDWWNVLTYWNQDEPYQPYYDTIGKVYEDGGCDEMFGEHVYCMFMNSGQSQGCAEQYVTLTERQVLNPCYDSIWHHYSGCKLYTISGYIFRPSTEPVAYIEDSSADEVNAANGLYFCPDRVCKPYSYYYPEFAKSASSSSESDSGDSGNSADSGDSSSASTLFAAFIAVAALF